jgi:hypothetical protein
LVLFCALVYNIAGCCGERSSWYDAQDAELAYFSLNFTEGVNASVPTSERISGACCFWFFANIFALLTGALACGILRSRGDENRDKYIKQREKRRQGKRDIALLNGKLASQERKIDLLNGKLTDREIVLTHTIRQNKQLEAANLKIKAELDSVYRLFGTRYKRMVHEQGKFV